MQTVAGVGGSLMRARPSGVADIEVCIAPLFEQRRIVEKIDSVKTKSGRARDHLDRLPRLVEKYKQAVLAAAFRGELSKRSAETAFPTREEQKSKQALRVRRGVPEKVTAPEFVAEWRTAPEWQLHHVGGYLHSGDLVDVKDGNHGATLGVSVQDLRLLTRPAVG
jgi:hypothetical protein